VAARADASGALPATCAAVNAARLVQRAKPARLAPRGLRRADSMADAPRPQACAAVFAMRAASFVFAMRAFMRARVLGVLG
jgi:hypothetical protein